MCYAQAEGSSPVRRLYCGGLFVVGGFFPLDRLGILPTSEIALFPNGFPGLELKPGVTSALLQS